MEEKFLRQQCQTSFTNVLHNIVQIRRLLNHCRLYDSRSPQLFRFAPVLIYAQPNLQMSTLLCDICFETFYLANICGDRHIFDYSNSILSILFSIKCLQRRTVQNADSKASVTVLSVTVNSDARLMITGRPLSTYC